METITADASETMLKVVEGDDHQWRRKGGALEIDSYTLMEKYAFDISSPEKPERRADTTVQASKFTLYDPHPLLHPSRKGTRLNEPEMFHAQPEGTRSEIERIPLLPKLGCSQVTFVAKKQKSIYDSYSLSEKTSNYFPKKPIRSQCSFAERYLQYREDNEPMFPLHGRSPSLPNPNYHMEQVLMLSNAISQPPPFLRARLSGGKERILLVQLDDPIWINTNTHEITTGSSRGATDQEDFANSVNTTGSLKSDRPASAPASTFNVEKLNTGDLSILKDINPDCKLQTTIIETSQRRSVSESLQTSSVHTKEEVIPMQPLRFPPDESIAGIVPETLPAEQTIYSKRQKVSIEELQKPITSPGFVESSSEEEPDYEGEPEIKAESTLGGTEVESSYFAETEASGTPTYDQEPKKKFRLIRRLLTCASCRSKNDQSKEKRPVPLADEGHSEFSFTTGRATRSSGRYSVSTE